MASSLVELFDGLSLRALTERQQIMYLQRQAAVDNKENVPTPRGRSADAPKSARASCKVDDDELDVVRLGCAEVSSSPPACWIARREVPSVGSIVAVHAHPDNDAAKAPLWYRARISKVVRHCKPKKSRANVRCRRGQVAATYDVDGSLDYLLWPDHENIRLVRMAPHSARRKKASGGATHDAPAAAVAFGGAAIDWAPLTSSAGRCVLSGTVHIIAPSAASMAALSRNALDPAFTFAGCSRRDGATLSEARLAAYKRIADKLLPAMRGHNHLFHITFASDTTTLVVLQHASCSGDEDAKASASASSVVGGLTFRLLRAGRAVIADVLTLAVAQRSGVCGRGLGTRLVNLCKRVALAEAERLDEAAPSPTSPMRCYVVTQAENLPKATNFWRKMSLQAGVVADHMASHMHQATPDKAPMYDCATTMFCELEVHPETAAAREANFVAPSASARAQLLPTPPVRDAEAGGPEVQTPSGSGQAGRRAVLRARKASSKESSSDAGELQHAMDALRIGSSSSSSSSSSSGGGGTTERRVSRALRILQTSSNSAAARSPLPPRRRRRNVESC